jgi:hypothetical protein
MQGKTSVEQLAWSPTKMLLVSCSDWPGHLLSAAVRVLWGTLALSTGMPYPMSTIRSPSSLQVKGCMACIFRRNPYAPKSANRMVGAQHLMESFGTAPRMDSPAPLLLRGMFAAHRIGELRPIILRTIFAILTIPFCLSLAQKAFATNCISCTDRASRHTVSLTLKKAVSRVAYCLIPGITSHFPPKLQSTINESTETLFASHSIQL